MELTEYGWWRVIFMVFILIFSKGELTSETTGVSDYMYEFTSLLKFIKKSHIEGETLKEAHCYRGAVRFLIEKQSPPAAFVQRLKEQSPHKQLEKIISRYIQKKGRLERDFLLKIKNACVWAMEPTSAVLSLNSWNKNRKLKRPQSDPGMFLTQTRSGYAVIDVIFPGSGAEKSGIKTGEYIIAVNNRSVKNMKVNELSKLLRGATDSSLSLKIKNHENKKIRTLSVNRAPFSRLQGEFRLDKKNKICEITLYSFLYNSVPPTKFIKNSLRSCKKVAGKLNGIVLDLRHNLGGDLEESIQTPGIFLNPDRIVTYLVSKKGRKAYRTFSGYSPDDGETPMLIRVSGNTASGAEIVARALQYHQRALLVGVQTNGASSVHGLRVRGDIIIKYKTGYFLGPGDTGGRNTGIQPDLTWDRDERRYSRTNTGKSAASDDRQPSLTENKTRIRTLHARLKKAGIVWKNKGEQDFERLKLPLLRIAKEMQVAQGE